jgi:hypothetical protein
MSYEVGIGQKKCPKGQISANDISKILLRNLV